MSYIGTEPKDIRSFGRTKFDYTASQGQTAFTGADDDGKVLAFTVGQIEVYVNGILMDDSDFTTTGTGTVTLASAANLNDVINIVSFETNIPDSNYVPASGGTFTGNVNFSGGTFSGDVDFGSNKITYANLYNNVSDLPSASTYHGMFAHVHNTGLAYYSHAGAWIPLANTTGATFSGNIVASDGINLGGTGASNKLDDYEEGTWTPAPSSGTMSTGTPWYIKIGNMVHCGANIWNFSDRSSNNHLRSTVPFQAATGKNATGSIIGRYIDTGTQSTWTPYLPGGDTSIYFYRNPSDADYTTLKHSDLNNSAADLHFHITYESV